MQGFDVRMTALLVCKHVRSTVLRSEGILRLPPLLPVSSLATCPKCQTRVTYRNLGTRGVVLLLAWALFSPSLWDNEAAFRVAVSDAADDSTQESSTSEPIEKGIKEQNASETEKKMTPADEGAGTEFLRKLDATEQQIRERVRITEGYLSDTHSEEVGC